MTLPCTYRIVGGSHLMEMDSGPTDRQWYFDYRLTGARECLQIRATQCLRVVG